MENKAQADSGGRGDPKVDPGESGQQGAGSPRLGAGAEGGQEVLHVSLGHEHS